MGKAELMEKWNEFLERLIELVGSVWNFVGELWMPVWERISGSTFLMAAGALAALILGIVLLVISFRRWQKNYDLDKEITKSIYMPAGFWWMKMIMKFFYPLLVLYIGMLFVRGMSIIEIEPMGFHNYANWYVNNQIFGGIIVLEFLFVSVLCLVRLKPFRLLVFWVKTIDFALIGALIGHFYLFLEELSSGNVIAGMLVFFLGIFLDGLIPFLLIVTALAPIYCSIIILLSPLSLLFHSFDIKIEMKDGTVWKSNMLFFLMDELLP